MTIDASKNELKDISKMESRRVSEAVPPEKNAALAHAPGYQCQVSKGPQAPTIDNVLPFYIKKAKQGHRVCLVTIVAVDGVSPRPVGSQIAVGEDGESIGFITGGCAEKAIVHEAMMSMRENLSRVIRIGSGSPWFDIKLPCGSGIDIHFSVANSLSVIEAACSRLMVRQPVVLQFDVQSDEVSIATESELKTTTRRQLFRRRYLPVTHLVIIGAGPYVDATHQLAAQLDFETTVWSPEDPATISGSDGNTARRMLSRTDLLSGQTFDQWTAALLLFHEHDWEPKLLKHILKSNCFYVGALGSNKSHQRRVETLRRLGVPESRINRIHGPIGLPIYARTPSEIAVSILAEVIETRNKPGVGSPLFS